MAAVLGAHVAVGPYVQQAVLMCCRTSYKRGSESRTGSKLHEISRRGKPSYFIAQGRERGKAGRNTPENARSRRGCRSPAASC
jgi:hypothetical protein